MVAPALTPDSPVSLLTALLFSLLAAAGPREDLVLAANDEAPEATRMAAFERLVTNGATDLSDVSRVATTEDADTRQRWVAIRVLGKLRGDRPRTLLLGLLDDPQPAIRTAAAQALGDLGDGTVARALSARLQDPAIIVRAAAAEALGKLRAESAVDPLSAALSARDNYYRGSSLWVRRHYVHSLGEIGSREAIPALQRCLDDTDTEVVREAVRAFEAIAGFSYAEGRDFGQQREAWRRWAGAQR